MFASPFFFIRSWSSSTIIPSLRISQQTNVQLSVHFSTFGNDMTAATGLTISSPARIISTRRQTSHRHRPRNNPAHRPKQTSPDSDAFRRACSVRKIGTACLVWPNRPGPGRDSPSPGPDEAPLVLRRASDVEGPTYATFLPQNSDFETSNVTNSVPFIMQTTRWGEEDNLLLGPIINSRPARAF
ncbi:hypothetical protein D9619_003629 [Psilocybe cf. subviscida]|uniref:Uncharacterized protein n=1 Tax=Psilocybe cf. subviscida TaxID=2480587 RepID=A0A8H5AXY5_9AGAR|nr:hypothetical protein D9619_003629 [Psilocybe cf. subviscida]